MAKKIDLKSLDWTSVLIDAAMQTGLSYEESRGSGNLGPQLREVIHAYQSENGDDDDVDDDGDDIDDIDDEHDDGASDAEERPQGEGAAGGQENDAELVHLRQQVAVLNERIAASEDRLTSEKELVASTRREASDRERELMGLLRDALCRGPVVQGHAGETATASTSRQPANPGDVAATSPEPPQAERVVAVDADPELAIAAEVEVEVEVDTEVEDDALPEIGVDSEVEDDSQPEVEVEVEVDTDNSSTIDSREVIDVEVVPARSDDRASLEDDDIVPATEEEDYDSLPPSAHEPDDKLLRTDPLGRADAALQRGEYADARNLFEALESKSRELGRDGEPALITIRRGLAESCLGLRDRKSALRASKQAWSAASSDLKTAPTAVSLFNYLSSGRVRGMALLAIGDPHGARRILGRACTHSARQSVDLSQAHQNELGVMLRLIQGIESAPEFKRARKPGRSSKKRQRRRR